MSEDEFFSFLFLNRSTVPFEKPVQCWLCECVCYTPRDLLFHLGTQSHMQEEHKLDEEHQMYFQ